MGNVNALLVAIFCFSLGFKYFDDLYRYINFIAIIFVLYKYKNNIGTEIANIPLAVKVAYVIFWGGMIVPSVMCGDNSDINKSFEYVRYSCPLLIGMLLANGNNIKKGVLLGFTSALLCTAAYGLTDYFFYERKRLISIYSHPNFAATYLEMIVPFVLFYFFEYVRRHKGNKYQYAIIAFVLAMGIISLFLTGSRGAIIGLVVAIVVSVFIYGFKYLNRAKFLFGTILVLLFVGTSLFSFWFLNNKQFTRSYDGERLLLIESSYNMWNDNKLFGVGLTKWKEEYSTKYILPEAKEPNLVQPHNIIAYYFSTTGLVGGLSFLIFSSLIFYYLCKNLQCVYNGGLFCAAMLVGFIAVMLHGLVDIGIVRKEFFRLFSGCLGITIAMISKEKKC